ncbi:MAG: hypothetical protein P8N58_06360 [Emcibacteraceae bacterium]|nr:hypothetical protein [Emcibacteraceae bacterium]
MKKYFFSISLIIPLFLTGCMTTSEVTSLGGNSYSLSTLACPACGGTYKAENMALDAANKFCIEQGKEAVIENADVDSWTFNGAGTTDLIFLCVSQEAEDDFKECGRKIGEIAKEKFGKVPAKKVAIKVFSGENGFGFSELSDHSYPTSAEQEIIKFIGSGFDECEDTMYSSVSSSDKSILQSWHKKILTIIAQLSGSKISYGSYAIQYNEINESLDVAFETKNSEITRNRQKARSKSLERFNSAMDSIPTSIPTPSSPINCTSTGVGDTVYTNCY